MANLIFSEYYGATMSLTDDQLEIILDLYQEWCNAYDEIPEVDNIEDLKENGNLLDHAIYHAEIQDDNDELDFLEIYN